MFNLFVKSLKMGTRNQNIICIAFNVLFVIIASESVHNHLIFNYIVNLQFTTSFTNICVNIIYFVLKLDKF